MESIIFKASDVVVVNFKDVDPNFARKGTDDVYSDRCLFGHEQQFWSPTRSLAQSQAGLSCQS